MIAPGEITMINREGKIFYANPTGLYDPVRQVFQYRVKIPNVESSLVVVDVSKYELSRHIRFGTPVLIVPVL